MAGHRIPEVLINSILTFRPTHPAAKIIREYEEAKRKFPDDTELVNFVCLFRSLNMTERNTLTKMMGFTPRSQFRDPTLSVVNQILQFTDPS